MSGIKWTHTAFVVDGDLSSESWALQGEMFYGHVSYDPRSSKWVGRLAKRMSKRFEQHAPDVEVSRDTPEGAREAVEELARSEWLKFPEVTWFGGGA